MVDFKQSRPALNSDLWTDRSTQQVPEVSYTKQSLLHIIFLDTIKQNELFTDKRRRTNFFQVNYKISANLNT